MNILTLINASTTFCQYKQVQISPHLAYKIMKFCKSVSTEEEFYNQKRHEIIDKYAVKDENGRTIVSEEGRVSFAEDKIDIANKELKELNEVEVEAPDIKFSLSELEELKLSISDMFALDAFVEG